MTRPHAVQGVHGGCSEAGADVVGITTFGADPADFAGHGTGEKIFELSRRGAEPVPEAADEAGVRFVPAATGPRAVDRRGRGAPSPGRRDFNA